MAQVTCKPAEAFTYKYLLSAPNGGAGENGRRSINRFITTSKTPRQIKATWENIVKESNGSVSLSDLYRSDLGINTIATVKRDLAIEDITVVITGEELRFKVPASWLFPDSAPGAHMHCKLSWELFQFPPNSLSSLYVDCEMFNRLEVSKTAVKKDGLFDQERLFDSVEDGGPNIGKWCIRATVQPSKNAYKAVVNLSAVPWQTRDFSAKPGNVDGSSYPNIHIKMIDGAPFNGKNTEEMGLPFYALLSTFEEGEFSVDTEEESRQFTENLISAVTSFYASAKKPVCLSLADWLDTFPDNNGEPDHDDISSTYVFPAWRPSSEESNSEDAMSDEAEVDTTGRESLSNISELKRLAAASGLGRSRLGSSSTGGSPIKKRRKAKASSPKPCLTDSEDDDDSPSPSKRTPIKKRRKKTKSPSPSDSEDDGVVPPSKKSKTGRKPPLVPKKPKGFKIPKKGTSELVPKNLWPSGSTAASIDKLTVEQVMTMKSLEAKINKEQKGELPGISLVVEDDEITPIRFEKATDNGRSKLHKARWLPLPIEDIEVWWPLIPAKRTDIICNLDLSRFGASCNVAQFTIRVRHDRRYKGLKAKHFLPQNSQAENRAKKTFMKQDGAGFTCENTLDFVDVECVRDVTTAVLNMQSVDAILWPMDYTANIILRVAAHFGYWAAYNLNPKDQVEIYKTLVREVLRRNAEKWNKPPMMFDEMVKLAENTMEHFECPSMRPFVYQKLKQSAKPAVVPKPAAPRPLVAPRPAAAPMDKDWDLKVEVKGSRCCISYNKGIRCARKVSGDFCHDGKSMFKYVHLCCKKVSGGVCGKTHPAVKHV